MSTIINYPQPENGAGTPVPPRERLAAIFALADEYWPEYEAGLQHGGAA